MPLRCGESMRLCVSQQILSAPSRRDGQDERSEVFSPADVRRTAHGQAEAGEFDSGGRRPSFLDFNTDAGVCTHLVE